MISLRPYQQAIVRGIAAARREGSTSILVVSPTGSGKTAIFADIARQGQAKGKRVLILVHRVEILEQTLTSLFRLGVTAGQIASGRAMTADSIQVAMVGTLAHRRALVRRPDLIITDEAHHAVSPSWRATLEYWREVPRLGFSATPERLDGRGLRELYADMVEGPSIADLVSDGWLATPALYRPPREVEASYHVKRGDFDQAEQEAVMGSRAIVGDVLDHYRQHLDRLPVVCFCVSVQHAYHMAEQFRAAGYVAMVVEGGMDKSERRRAIGGLADGSVHVVCSCEVISEGVDVPVMAGAIMLRRTMSLALYLQQAGRALRPIWPVDFEPAGATAAERIEAMARAGKPRAIILDHAGNYHLHGHVMAPRVWSLDALSRRERKERAPTTTTCPRCYGIWPGVPRVCPACGYEWKEEPTRQAKPLRVIAGELIEAGLDVGEAASVADVYKRAMSMDPKERARALLGYAFRASDKRAVEELAKLAGYNPKWSDWAWSYRQKRRAG